MAQLILDDWQKQALEHRGNLLLCTGRQVGKTTIMAIKAGAYMLANPNSKIIIVSLTEDQAKLIIVMILDWLEKNSRNMIARGKHKPTQNRVVLKNGSQAIARPVGNTGDAVRGFTGNVLIIDEASRMPELAFQAGMPTLLTTGGEIWMCSTPFGKQGYFYECFLNKDNRFKVIHTNSEEVIRNRPINAEWTEEKKQKALAFLESEKQSKSKNYYGQEYLGLFLDDLRQFFPDNVILRTMTSKRPPFISPGDYSLGVDVAGMGSDVSTFEILLRNDDNRLIQVENLTTSKTYTNQTTDLIVQLNNKYNFRKIYIDDGGLGFGVFSQLLQERQTKSKVVAINNAKRSLDKNNKAKKKLFKEDLYNNLLRLMERKEIFLLDDPDIFLSLKSVQYEFENGQFKIFGNNTHIAEGLVRSAWIAQEKTIKLMIDYI